MAAQMGLFDEGPDGQDTPDARRVLEARFARLSGLAARVPEGVRFGTSSWSFPGWRGLVYAASRRESELAREGLREYSRHPLFGTVGIDRSYYAPVPDEDLRRYAEQLPAGFPCCCKAPADVTSPFASDRGANAANPGFLSAERLVQELLEPIARLFREHAGPVILQFPPMVRRVPLDANSVFEGLDRFLGSLPRDFQYAVEVRDRALLAPAYLRVLARHGAGHVYNLQTGMPRPGEQALIVPPETMPFVVVRLLVPPNATYQQQRDAFAPFNALAAPDHRMRTEVTDLVGRAVARAIPAFVLVNNKAEGSAPLTIEALAEMMAGRRTGSTTKGTMDTKKTG